ncbi:type II secretion system protein [Longimicrobium sp.]|uniref:PilW family protein n=1 Tax=Longimicrobium sp. TaxID=2029185 RepID=UPI002BC2579F|nr:type II secretion system protein [Longimicrobium sp.]HSU13195.1 type II secretion system protein [Longimicrobium sp.]
MSSASRRLGREGFTLVEVLVAMVLAVLLGGVIFEVVRGEGRFAAVQSARQEVQQNARGALEILSSELRAAQASGLVRADADGISFLVPRAWGVSCGGGSAAQRFAVFPDVPDAGALMFEVNTATGVLGNTGTDAAPVWAPNPNPDAAARATVNSIVTLDLNAAGNACIGIRPNGDGATVRGVTINGANLPAVPAGNTLYLYQWVRYDVRQDGTEWWIYRSLGVGDGTTQQPLAGPLTGADGLQLTYFTANGAALAAPGTTLANLQQVARIGIRVKAASRTKGRTNQVDELSASVQLRN